MNNVNIAPSIGNTVITDHDQLISVEVKTTSGTIKTLALSFSSSDCWLNWESITTIREELGARLNRLAREDNSVIAYNNQYYKRSNGILTLMYKTPPIVL